MLFMPIPFFMGLFQYGGPFSAELLGTVLPVLYYTFTEGTWGCSLGKAVLGLRVIGPDKGTPSLPRTLLRSSFFKLLPGLPGLILLPLTSLEPSIGRLNLVASTSILLWGLIFVTARKRNGWAGMHELISGSRVVEASKLQERKQPPTQPMTLVKADGQIGPYRITGEISQKNDERLVLAHDPDLQRDVWVHIRDRRVPVLANWRRDLDRPGRLRWLNGSRGESQSWDAYEALSGCPLLGRLTPDKAGGAGQSGQPWEQVRNWFQDLAVELVASLDDPLPKIPASMERVWITNEGRAKLIDTALPIVEAEPSRPQELSLTKIQQFLHQVGCSALEGGVSEPRHEVPKAPFPMHLREFFRCLARSTVETPNELLQNVQTVVRQAAVMSSTRRLGHLIACSFLTVALSTIFLGVVLARLFLERSYPGATPLRECLQEVEKLQRKSDLNEEERLRLNSLEVYISGHFRSLAERPPWSSPISGRQFTESRRRLAEQLWARPPPSDNQLADAAEILERRDTSPGSQDFVQVLLPIWGFVCVLLMATGLLAVLSSLVWPGGVLLHLLGIIAVGADGESISRLRGLFRTIVAWSPAYLSLFLIERSRSHNIGISLGANTPLDWIWGGLALAIMLAGAAIAFFWPQRGLQDRIAGTYLVPR